MRDYLPNSLLEKYLDRVMVIHPSVCLSAFLQLVIHWTFKFGARCDHYQSVIRGGQLAFNIVGYFKGLPDLVMVDLRFNQISRIDAYAFSAVPSITDLQLTGNKLQVNSSHRLLLEHSNVCAGI